ncbi:hypothetical protein E2C01_084128 [Portunus trituberculatus]|uniref:Uncharacterized protein n=1 Tax=Portunus trituberculatus TaxID=210409 RepID=A0A5B7IZ40_PORTR|nr:hypothetical protein [Portunus trituberculatus]
MLNKKVNRKTVQEKALTKLTCFSTIPFKSRRTSHCGHRAPQYRGEAATGTHRNSAYRKTRVISTTGAYERCVYVYT